MAGWVSTVPDAINALVSLWTAAIDDSTVRVSDGPAVGGDGTQRQVSVGWDGNDGSVQMQSMIADFGAVSNREVYSIFCSVITLSGVDVPTARQQAFDLYTTICSAISDDLTLGGVVAQAVPTNAAIHQEAGSTSYRVVIAFGVEVQAFTKEASDD